MTTLLYKTDEDGTAHLRRRMLTGLLLAALLLGFVSAFHGRGLLDGMGDGDAAAETAEADRSKRKIGDVMIELGGQNLLLTGLKLQVAAEATRYSDAALRDMLLGIIHQALHMPLLYQDIDQVAALRRIILILAEQQAPWLEGLQFGVSLP
ncbi:hypothetical protein ACFSUD_08280 [Sulfitobacter aestuarii]|uniref:Uncharacterized protein n=1 Tax=Sulfitobacter aestuarii TaxID=2161676 RepID=A0ABW5U0Y3_9RHOB